MWVNSTSLPADPFHVPEQFILFTHISFELPFACAELPRRLVRSTFMILPCLPEKVIDSHSSKVSNIQRPSVTPDQLVFLICALEASTGRDNCTCSGHASATLIIQIRSLKVLQHETYRRNLWSQDMVKETENSRTDDGKGNSWKK
jgi:hypothetical protein